MAEKSTNRIGKIEGKINEHLLTKLTAIIHKIPLFEGLPRHSLAQIITLCKKLTIPEGSYLVKQGDDSNALYILLYGKLVVKVRNSAPVATIDPVSSIGEMGVFTGEKRSASVQAMKESGVLCLRKRDLETLLNNSPDIGVRIMAKIIKILSERIAADNAKIYEFQNYVLDKDDEEKDSDIESDTDADEDMDSESILDFGAEAEKESETTPTSIYATNYKYDPCDLGDLDDLSDMGGVNLQEEQEE